MVKILDKILKYGSCLLVFLLPLLCFRVFIFPYITTKFFFFYSITEILSVVWIYTIILDTSYRLSKRQLLYFTPLIIYVLWMTISGFLGANPNFSFWSSLSRGTGLLTLYHCLALSLIISSLVKRNGKNYLNSLMFWFINGGFVLGLSLWFGNEGFKILLSDSNGGGLIGNSSLAATYLIFVLAFCFFLLFSKVVSKSKKYWIGIITVIIFFSPVFLNIPSFFSGAGLLGSAHGAFLGIGVMGGVAFLSYFVLSQNKVFRLLGIIGIILGMTFFISGWIQLNNSNTKLHQEFIQSASGSRFIFWNSAQESINQHPWFGWGPENYTIAFQKNFDPKIATSEYRREGWNEKAHNIYYDTGVAGGYPAVALYGLFLLSILYGLYKLRDKEIFNQMQIAVFGGLLVGYIFQNLFIFDSINSLVALFVTTGVIFALHSISDKNEYSKIIFDKFARASIAIGLTIICIISLIFFVYLPAKKTILFNTIINMPINIRPSHYEDLLKGSLVGEQWDVSGIADTLFLHYSTNFLVIKNNKELLPYVENDLAELLKYLEIVSKRNKTDTRLYISMVGSYLTKVSLSDKPYDSVLADHLFDILNKAKYISPNNPEIYWTEAQVYAWKGDIKAVEDTYKKAIALDSNIPDSHLLLIKFAKAIGDQKLYQASLLEAKKDIPNFVEN